ncbi:protein FAM171A1 isoform X2 [Hypomesus transpacificus]|uniref:protein FAM171A1 isoform X2 n=1 Tax=Hypomesus transpacificus TaxID=137520 RepID=UPI001F0848F1|nr:protein FAM171A1 isoform X2 [Hypomesus transpacificus]
MRLDLTRRTAAIVLCLLGCNIWRAATKTLQEDNGIKEVTLKVHLSDASTHQPLGGATIELFTNHTPVTMETSAADGNAYLRFPYRLGTPLVVTATKQGYVPNSAPWSPTRLPVFSTLSLDLLPERTATLMVYDDVVQIVSGFQVSRAHPWVQFQRRALSLPPNTSYTNLSALLTVASAPAHMQHFPYLQGLQGLGGNGSGSERRFELTPVAAISVHLLASDGVELLVNEPISISVPLPANSGLKDNDHIPAWRFDPRLGVWLKSSLGYVQREGDHLILTYIAPQLGYWVAAMSPVHTGEPSMSPVHTGEPSMSPVHTGEPSMSPVHTGEPSMSPVHTGEPSMSPVHTGEPSMSPVHTGEPSMSPVHTGPMVAKDISTYHTVFLLAILGGMVLILLCLLCLLLYYCRRCCLKPRLSRRKLTLAAALDGSKRDQATSMSHLHLISNEVQLEMVSTATEPDMTTPMLKPSSYDQHHQELVSHGNHSRSSLVNHSRHGSSLGNLTPRSRDYRQSVETFPLKTALSTGTDRGYRQSYTSVCSSTNQVLDRLSLTNHVSQISSGGEATSPSSPPLSPSRAEAMESRPPDYHLSRSVDHLERTLPLSLPRPGQLLCCGSVDLLSGGEAYPRRVRPTLVIPAHYMRLPGEHPLCGQALLLQMEQQSDLETIQAELNATHPQQPSDHSPDDCSPGSANQGEGDGRNLSESLSIPTTLGESGLVEINDEDTLLAEKTLMELRGGKPLPHPRAWFVSLDGRSNAHIRHSYIDLQRAGCHGNSTGGGGRRSGRHGNSNDTSLDSGVDLNEPRVGRRWKEDRKKDRAKSTPPAVYTQPVSTPPAVYTQLVYVDDLEGPASEGEATPETSPGNGQQPDTQCHQEKMEEREEKGEEVEEGGVIQIQEEAPSPSSSSPSSPPPLSPPEGVAFRTEHAQTSLLSVSPDNDPSNDDGEGEKKSPWQKREERPLLAFNLK